MAHSNLTNLESTGTIDMTGNVWTHVALTRDTAGQATLYIDGVANGTKNWFTGGITASNSILTNKPFWIGARSLDGGSTTNIPFKGAIDEVRVWNTLRNATDITSTASGELTGTANTGLAGYWQLNQASLDTTTAADSAATFNTGGSITTHDGTLTNFTFDSSTSDWGNTTPQLNAAASPVLTTIAEDAAAPSGGVTISPTQGAPLVSALLGTGGIANLTDTDTIGTPGIAITASNTSNGTLYYSTETGASWTSITGLSDSNALLLTNASSNMIYYTPSANVNGSITDAITFRAWDGTDGKANGATGVNAQPASTASISA
ncbi:MAG: LamG-like jellyroll fold domain-containing protein, partial [Mariprofundaceae bacterium]|nr:LamG-like jellyroll fold domain-containing protein [Mariprofundaceae bacterium]